MGGPVERPPGNAKQGSRQPWLTAAFRIERLIQNIHAGLLHPGFCQQVAAQAGIFTSSPSLASSKVPEHCAPMSGLVESSLRCVIKPESSATSRVFVPLPMMTASVSHVSAKVGWDGITTPFIDVTVNQGPSTP